ncbi:MAG TPA: hypothetical protein VK140_00365 [Ktedonobacteraceae bacterium]|nr:hypothetical protein [Ktedonobacteraceae bacterium]
MRPSYPFARVGFWERYRGSRRGGALVAARGACCVFHPSIPVGFPTPRAATRAPTPHPLRSRPYAVTPVATRSFSEGDRQVFNSKD